MGFGVSATLNISEWKNARKHLGTSSIDRENGSEAISHGLLLDIASDIVHLHCAPSNLQKSWQNIELVEKK